MDAGTEMELAAGDAHVTGPGHDAWVIGDEPLVAIDVIGADKFAKQGAASTSQGRTVACPCGIHFSVKSADRLDELVKAVREHALASHAQSLTREQVLAQPQGAPA